MSANLLGYIVKRLLLMVPTLLGILLVTFTLIQFVPGGPVEQMVQMLKGDHAATGIAVPGGSAVGDVGQASGVYRGRVGVDPQKLEEIKALYGFDKPAHERFIDMVVGFARFDLGTSFFYNRSVWELIVEKLPVSASLGLWSFLLTYLVSIPLGISKAVRHGSPFDLYTSLAILIGYAIPGFVLGVIMLVFFGGGSFFQIFPLRGLTSDDFEQLSLIGKVLDYFWHLALPLTCLVIGSFAVITMLTKNTMLEEIRRQYALSTKNSTVPAPSYPMNSAALMAASPIFLRSLSVIKGEGVSSVSF